MIDMECPSCGHDLHIKDEYAGAKGVCKYCGVVFDVAELPFSDGVLPPMLDAKLETTQSESSEHVANAPVKTHQNPPPQKSELDPLGYGRWLVIFLIPPLGLLTSMLAPSNHPEKVRAVATSVAMMGVGIALFIWVTFWIDKQMLQYDLGWIPEAPQKQEMTFRDETVELLLAGSKETILSQVKVPTVSGVKFEPVPPFGLTGGPFAHEDLSGLTFYSGTANETYEIVIEQYEKALEEAGWVVIDIEKSFRGTINSTNFSGQFKGKSVYLQITESNVDVKVTFVARHE
jgi:hypothetical protein